MNKYSVNANLEKGFDVISKTSNNNEYLLKMQENQDGPMDLFTVALSGCILMCAKGYFFRKYETLDLKIDLDLTVNYDEKICLANINVNYENFTDEDRQGILENIKLRCKISHLIKNNVELKYIINGK